MCCRFHLARALLLLLLPLFTFTAQAARPACTDHWPEEGLNLAGEINGEEIQGYLDTGFPARSDNGISGVFFFPARWNPGQDGTDTVFSMEGTLTDDCQMQLEDVNGGVWRLHFVSAEVLEGTMEQPETSAAVTLRLVAPTDCSGRGSWRRYDSPDWPITFEYPSSWRLAATGEVITIECPDAESLARGESGISLQRGRGRESIVTEKGSQGTRIGSFVTFGGREWLRGICEEPDDRGLSCRTARKSTWRGMTVLQGSAGEDRRYRAGGGHYVGQGSGITSYLFVIGDSWVSIDSDDSSRSLDDVPSPGPVNFKGDGVTERLVRSIRRR